MVALLQQMKARAQEEASAIPAFPILIDASGPFFTGVTEGKVESFAAWETGFREMMARPAAAEWFSRVVPFVDSGRREVYTLEDSSCRLSGGTRANPGRLG